jgi:hypothetical protein
MPCDKSDKWPSPAAKAKVLSMLALSYNAARSWQLALSSNLVSYALAPTAW